MKKLMILLILLLNCNKSIKELIIKEKIGNKYWEYIKEDKDEELEEFLNNPLNKDIDINCKDEDGETGLTLAAKNNSLEVIKLLLSKEGINIDLVNGKGETALTLALEKGHIEIVNLLIGAGANINDKNKN